MGNIVRKVLKVIREEAAGVNSQVGSGYTTPTRPPSEHSIPSGAISVPMPSLASLVLLGHSGLQKQQPSATGLIRRSAYGSTIGEPESLLDDPSKKAFAMKPALIDAIQEVINELETVYENVAKNAREYIHSEFVLRQHSHLVVLNF